MKMVEIIFNPSKKEMVLIDISFSDLKFLEDELES